MGGTLEVYWGTACTAEGVREVLDFARLYAPVKPVAIAADFRRLGSYSLPRMAGSPAVGRPVEVWSWTDSPRFELLAAQFREGGYGCLSLLIDAPVSGEDPTPMGEAEVPDTTYRRVCHLELSCFAPLLVSSSAGRVHGTLATAAGLDADGRPALMTDAAAAPGRVYRAWLTNLREDAEATADVYVRH